MSDKINVNPKHILEEAKTILLVDWPNTSIPRELLSAGFTVFGYSPNGYAKAELVEDTSHDMDEQNIFPSKKDEDKDYLVFHKIASRLAVRLIATSRAQAPCLCPLSSRSWLCPE